MAQNIARLGVVLGIDTAEFTKGIESAKRKLGDIGNFAMKAGAVATAALTAMTYKALQYSDQMSDLSDATGVSIAKIVQMSQALQQSGGNAEDAGKVLIKFAQNIDKARDGSQEMQDAFAKAGVTLKDLATLPLEQLLDKTTNGISKLGDKATQTGTKLDLFGKGLRTVDMEGFNSLMSQSTAEFQKYEDAIRQAAKLNDELAHRAAMTGLVFTEKVIPSLNLFFEIITKEGGSSLKVLETGLEAVGWLIRNIALGFEGLSAGVQTLGVSAKAFFGIITKDEAFQQMVNIENALNKSIDKVKEFNKEKEKGAPIAAQTVNVPVKDSPEVKKFQEMKRVAEQLSEEYKRQQNYSLQQLAIRDLMIGMTEDERRIQEAINQVTDETSRKIDDITKKREDAVARAPAGRGDEIRAIYDAQIAEILRLEDVYIEAAKTNQKYSIETQRTFEFGWNKAFNQFAEDAYNYGKFAEEAFKSFTGNMTSAIDQFVETGKFSFSNFAESVIKDLIKIQLRMQAMQLFSQAKGFLGGLFGGGGGEWTPSSTGLLEFSGAADGGMINGPTIVGENGPELFIPQRSGTVIPNQQMSGMTDSQPTIVYNGPYIASMSAIDTQSATQFLARNKLAVWSANQSAGRSLPASRT